MRTVQYIFTRFSLGTHAALPYRAMKGFITVTVLPQKNPTTIALHVIGIVTSEEIRSNPSTTVVLSFGSGGKTVYSVAESYEEVLKLIEAAQ